MKAVGIFFWVAGIVLVSLMVFRNVDEVRTFENTAIKSEKIVIGIGHNLAITAKDVSLVAFLGREYDLVMIGKDGDRDNTIVFLGESDKEYYSVAETIPVKILQGIKEIRINGDSTEIIMGKQIMLVVFLSIIAVFFFGVFGFLSFSK